jgi:aryl-alcohol dehydrogenase-like predicted oxidoreductase
MSVDPLQGGAIRVGLGCVGLGTGAGRSVADDVRLVGLARELGITTFDTADAYGNGASERVLGRALRTCRDEVTIATKAGYLFRRRSSTEQWARRHLKPLAQRVRSRRPTGVVARASVSRAWEAQDFSVSYLRNAVGESLKRLRTDRIDIFQLHGIPDVQPELLDQLSDLVAAGDIGRFGIGADSVAHAEAWIGVPGISMVQVPLGIVDPQAATSTLPLAREHRCGVWVRGVLAGGLVGLAERDPAALVDDPKAARIAGLRRIADEAGIDLSRLAFGFLRAYAQDISVVLVGTTSPDHLRRNVELLAAPPLPADVLDAVVALDDPTGGRG